MKNYFGTTLTDILATMLTEMDGVGHVYIVVPDRFSLEAETALLSASSTGATTSAEVTTLARIVDKLSTHTQKRLSAEGAVMAIADIMARQKEQLLCLKGDSYGSTAAEVYATIAQLSASDVQPEDLDTRIDDPSLARKVHDLGLIYRQYRDFMSKGYADASAQIMDAVSAIPSAVWVKEARFYVVGYDALTRTNARLIETLDRYARSVTVGSVSAEFAFGAPKIASQFPLAVRVRVPSLATPLREKLWLSADEPNTLPFFYRRIATPDEEILLLEASDATEGVERIARDIAEYVRNGARYRDFAVLCEDVNNVGQILQEYSIPVNADKTYSLRLDPLTRLVIDGGECALTHYYSPTLRRVALNPLLDISPQDFAIWDNYILRFGVDFDRHLLPYTLIAKDDSGERETAETVRKRLNCAISGYVLAISQSKTVGEFVDAVRELITSKSQKAEEVRTRLSARLVDFSRQAEPKLHELLDNLAYSSSSAGTALSFLRMFGAGIKASAISVTPTLADAVNVFTADSFGFRRYSRVFWMGADEGQLPSTQADCGLISDMDIDRLKNLGAAIDPKISEVNERARYRVFSTLFLSPALTVVMATKQPNFFARLLRDKLLCPIERANEDGLTLTETEDARKTVCRAAVNTASAERAVRQWIRLACSRADKALSSAVSTLAVAVGVNLDCSLEMPITNAHELFFGSERTSVSQLEKFFTCPFMHFAQYGLRCQEQKVANVKASDIGNFLHAVVEAYAVLEPTSIEESDQVALSIANALIQKDELLTLESVALAASRLRQEAILTCRTLFEYRKLSDYKTERVEVAFGSDLPALEVGGVALCGKIDRIDSKEDSVVIIDYKTGTTNYTYKHMYFGQQLQLFAYMRILTKLGKKPAAALFFPINNDYGKQARCTGWVNSDPQIIAALDKDLGFSSLDSRFLPIGLNATQAKKGEWKLKGEEALLSEENWTQWLDYTEALIKRAVVDIDAGCVKASPLNLDVGRASPCSYCAVAAACVSNACERMHVENIKKATLAEDREDGEI